MESLAGAPGAQLAGIGDGPLSPEKNRDNLARINILGSNPSELGCLIGGGMIQGETQLQKAETYQDENKSVLTADSRKVHYLKESKLKNAGLNARSRKTVISRIFFPPLCQTDTLGCEVDGRFARVAVCEWKANAPKCYRGAKGNWPGWFYYKKNVAGLRWKWRLSCF